MAWHIRQSGSLLGCVFTAIQSAIIATHVGSPRSSVFLDIRFVILLFVRPDKPVMAERWTRFRENILDQVILQIRILVVKLIIAELAKIFLVVCFLLGNSPASGVYMPTFRNTLFHLWRWNIQSVPKRRHINSRRRGITQKKAYNIQNTAKAWNQGDIPCFYQLELLFSCSVETVT